MQSIWWSSISILRADGHARRGSATRSSRISTLAALSMVRSAAKNHASVTIVTDPADYARLLAEMDERAGATSYDFRRLCAAKAYAATAEYDAHDRQLVRLCRPGQDVPRQLAGAAQAVERAALW